MPMVRTLLSPWLAEALLELTPCSGWSSHKLYLLRQRVKARSSITSSNFFPPPGSRCLRNTVPPGLQRQSCFAASLHLH